MATQNTLYIAPASAPCRAVLYHLRLLGIADEYEIVEVDLAAGEHRSEDFVRMNPRHCVPTLRVVEDGHEDVYWESRAIMRMHEDIYRPLSPDELGHTLRWLAYDQGTLYPLLSGLVYPVVFGGMPLTQALAQEAWGDLDTELSYLDSSLANRMWLAGGSTWTVADISIATSMTLLTLVIGVQGLQNVLAPHAQIQRWGNAFANLDARAWDEINAPFWAWRDQVAAQLNAAQAGS